MWRYLVASPLAVVHGRAERRVNTPRGLHFGPPSSWESRGSNVHAIHEETLHTIIKDEWNYTPSFPFCCSREAFGSSWGFALLLKKPSMDIAFTFGFLKTGQTFGLWLRLRFCADWSCWKEIDWHLKTTRRKSTTNVTCEIYYSHL